jgi:hypothetical protein
LLLPEWLRDGDVPAATNVESKAAQPAERAPSATVAEVVVVEEIHAAAEPAVPFSDRLSFDTRLDPGQLVSASDLPAWLGGIGHTTPAQTVKHVQTAPAITAVASEALEPYEGIDAPEDGVIDIEVNGWVIIAAALGLLILLAAALRLYLT